MSALNVELLRKIQKHILEEPRRLDMTAWLDAAPVDVVPCGTVACIAGWALHLSNTKPGSTTEGGKWSGPARKVLGLSYEEGDKLFYEDNWPAPFATNFCHAEGPKARAKIAVARIDYLIREGK